MSSLLYQRIQEFLETGDPRMKTWPLMSSPLASSILTVVYFAFVYFGPRFMDRRQPLKSKLPLQFYNFCMVCLALYIVIKMCLNMPSWDYFLHCQRVDYSNDPRSVGIAEACWVYLLSKFIEFLDTVFIILRKKSNHLTFLHVFHHGVLPINWWFGVKFASGGAGAFHATVNAIVHVIMYSYYFLAAFGPSVQKHLWWKNYITRIQISQFLIVAMHTILMLMDTVCQYPRVFLYMILTYEIVFLVLFIEFYLKTYVGKQTSEQVEDTKSKKET